MKLIRRCFDKIGIILPALALSGLLAIGGTYAWNQYNLSITNELKADTVKAEVVEETAEGLKPAGEQKKEVKFTNGSGSSVFLRMTYTEYWEKSESEDKRLLSNTVDVAGMEKDVATKNWATGFSPDQTTSEWFLGKDGWYYYKKILKPGTSTNLVLESVSFPNYTESIYSEYANADYNLYFKSEVVQASDGNSTLNSSEVNSAATNKVFGVTADVDKDKVNVTWKE